MSSGAPLPGPGEPGEATTAARGEILTLREAATAYNFDAAQLERLAEAGEIRGAYRAPGPEGETWRIPVQALNELSPGAWLEAAPASPPGQPAAATPSTSPVETVSPPPGATTAPPEAERAEPVEPPDEIVERGERRERPAEPSTGETPPER